MSSFYSTKDKDKKSSKGKYAAVPSCSTESFKSVKDPTPNSSAVASSSGAEESEAQSQSESVLRTVARPGKRRTRVPDRPNCSVNLWSVMKNCIGKELSKIPMPVNNQFNIYLTFQ